MVPEPTEFVHAAALEIIPASRDHFVPCVGHHVLPVRESLPGARMQAHSQLRYRHRGQGLHRVQVQALYSAHLLIQGKVGYMYMLILRSGIGTGTSNFTGYRYRLSARPIS
jgi:hypothetical protein